MKKFFSAAYSVLLVSFVCSFSGFIYANSSVISKDELKKQSREVIRELLQELLAGVPESKLSTQISQSPNSGVQNQVTAVQNNNCHPELVSQASHKATPGTAGSRPLSFNSCHPRLDLGLSAEATQGRRLGSKSSASGAHPELVEGDLDAEIDQELDRLTRAVGNGFPVSTSAFAGENKFYVGPTESVENNTLSRIEHGPTGSLVWTPITPESVLVNGSLVDNPIKDKALANIVLAGDSKLPIVALAGSSASNVDIRDVFWLTKDDGSEMLRLGAIKLLDAEAATIDKQVVALAASSDSSPCIFAAVVAADNLAAHQWKSAVEGASDGKNRGITFLKPNADKTKLEVKNDTNDEATNHAATKVDLEVNKAPLIAFRSGRAGITRALIGSDVSMYWDKTLDCLYVGLSDVSRGDDAGFKDNLNGGVCSVFMGRLDVAKSLLTLTPVISGIKKEFFDAIVGHDPSKDVLGFYRDTYADDVYKKFYFATAWALNVMHSSVGTPYLIGNIWVREEIGDAVNNPKNSSHVCAVPLVASGGNAGCIAGKIDHTKIATVLAGGLNSNPLVQWTEKDEDLFVKVGADPQYLSYSDNACVIQDLKVYGDTVYVSVAGTRGAGHDEAGIFASTAVFDGANKKIRAWTPWRRMIGNTNAAGGFGLDATTGRFWYLTTADGKGASSPEFKDAKATEWGKGEKSDTLPENSTTLASIIDSAFAESGGVLGLFNFGPGTQGFKAQKIDADGSNTGLKAESRRYPQFSMSVVTGKGIVALVNMGQLLDGVFEPATGFTSSDVATYDPAKSPVFVFNGSDSSDRNKALLDIGEIVCAEVSHLPLKDKTNNGWLFVGGTKGVAVLAKEADRSGWDTSVLGGLSAFGPKARTSSWPAGSQWKFLKLMRSEKINVGGEAKIVYTDPFLDDTGKLLEVRKIVSDQNKYLYVLTSQKLFRIEMNQVDFKKGGDVTQMSLDTAKIQEINLTNILAGTDLFDMMVVQAVTTVGAEKTKLLLATSKGVWQSDSFAGVAATWTNQTVNGGATLGHALKFDFVSTQPGDRLKDAGGNVFNADGNLYVLAADDATKNLAVYRFDVKDGGVTAFTEPYPKPAGGGGVTPYFYKLGDIVGSGKLYTGPKDLAPHAKDILSSENGFASNVPLHPNPDKFLPDNAGAFKEINLGLTITPPLRLGKIVPDEAAGALYTYGEFGVRVNKPIEAATAPVV